MYAPKILSIEGATWFLNLLHFESRGCPSSDKPMQGPMTVMLAAKTSL